MAAVTIAASIVATAVVPHSSGARDGRRRTATASRHTCARVMATTVATPNAFSNPSGPPVVSAQIITRAVVTTTASASAPSPPKATYGVPAVAR